MGTGSGCGLEFAGEGASEDALGKLSFLLGLLSLLTEQEARHRVSAESLLLDKTLIVRRR